ncbi:Uncharacterised protein [Corynebacterium kutscheri]|uniref:FCS-type domain-containing protein n=1 Tax=Corynebacterium kutscheri TaxID=35755 RepID=A0AB38VYA4_9CORY|nr:hypothetical protein [Corynebacterium kutscheri]VEH08468.1 Uncharacterised protein [Corynebacterium kutscheri]VEH79597.1 Uncharacterised protein [Corynebacterium kutscheri]
MTAHTTKRNPTCQWCGTEFLATSRGRPRKFCSHACRQRAYEQRNAVTGTNISPDAVIMHPEKAVQFHDSLFELRCAAEDIATAVTENADPAEVNKLCSELVNLARRIEKIR